MTSETEIRSRPLQRQAGFNVSQNGNDNNMKSNTSPSRIRTTTGDTVVRGSFDGDVEMGEEKRVVYPVPILRSQDLLKSNNNENDKDSNRSRNGLPTPPDHISYNARPEEERKTQQAGNDVKLPSLHSTLISPRIATISSSHVSSGPASISSAQWSPGHSSDPHLYSISSQPYSNASVRPYLSTSFQTSAERGAGTVRGPPNSSGLLPRQPQNDEMDDDDDDVFGNTAQGLGLHNTGEPSPPQLRRSNDMDREEGDAAGVFSFSSPYFGPRSLETADVPPLSPPPGGNDSRSNAYAQRMMSPSWTAASLGKLSLGGSSVEGPSSTSARRPPYGTSPRNTMANAHAAYSRSLPSGAAGLPIGGQARRSSFQKRTAPGPGLLHPHSSYYKSTDRTRSTSRSRPERTSRTMENVDDDETDEDEQMASREQDDDATEDEAEPQNHARYEKRYSRPDEAGYVQQPHRHPSGQPTTMSASYERAQSGLSRQYSSDRYAHLGMSRHHPYAASPSGASPSNGSILASYSPNNARVPIGRRRSSFGQGAMLSGSPSNGMMHALSHSPRYIQSIPTRDRPTIGSYTSASGGGGDYSHYAGSLPQHTHHSNLSGYGESPDTSSAYNASRRRYEVYGDEEEEDEDEEESRLDHRRANGNGKSSTHRSTSANRAAAAAASSAGAGGGDVDSPEMLEVNAIRERLGGAANCSAFISKLWYLMCRPELYSKYIHWSESGDSVILSNDPDINNEFASEVLPKLFKHGNNASFVRQLNLYGFQRVPSSRLLDAAEIKAARRYANGNNISTALQLYGPHSSFAHPRFKKDQESLLPSMKPRSSKKTKKGGNQGDLSGGRGDSDVGEDEFAL